MRLLPHLPPSDMDTSKITARKEAPQSSEIQLSEAVAVLTIEIFLKPIAKVVESLPEHRPQELPHAD